jgi:hypothetical protein
MNGRGPAMVVLVALVAVGGAWSAQPPERQHDVLIPGMGVRLREAWQMLFHDGCRYAVPVAWRPIADRSQVFAPDGSSVSIWALHVSNWSLHKARLKAAFSHESRVHEDSDSRLWIESRDSVRLQHYVAVTDGAAACAGLLEIRSAQPNADDTIAGIVESIGMATAWPADIR